MKEKGESKCTKSMHSLQFVPTSAATHERHFNKSPWCIRQNLRSDVKQLAKLPISIIDRESKSWAGNIRVDIGY